MGDRPATMRAKRGKAQNDTPVFYDPTGRRWRWVKVIGMLVLIVVAVLSAAVVPATLAWQQPGADRPVRASEKRPAESPEQIAAIMNSTNTPVIGDGPLVRVVRVEQEAAAVKLQDPFTGGVLSHIADAEEQLALVDQRYALQRYGNEHKKRLFLTFDDGPDPTYTPGLLDVLSKEGVTATFFIVGSNAAKQPELVKRIAREGHVLANHTFTHIDFDRVAAWRGAQEINQTERILRGTAQQTSVFFRPPYAGDSDQSLRNAAKGLLTAQSMGYVNAFYDFDSRDWQFASGRTVPRQPDLNGTKDMTVLLHDAGGDRSRTLPYVKDLIRQAKTKGYTFQTMDQIAASGAGSYVKIQPARGDYTAFLAAAAVLVWPRKLIIMLFVTTLTLVLAVSLGNVLLTLLYKRRERRRKYSPKYLPDVTIIVPAYNEGVVVAKTVQSLRQSEYPKLDILLVDDGSQDDTWQVMLGLVDKYDNVHAIHQENTGKAGAINLGLTQTDSPVIVCADADTIFPPDCIGKLVRHFNDPAVGAVAGMVQVGNARGIITSWQALEYMVSIGLERNAQAQLGSVMVVPGACGAWRRRYVLEAGGFSHRTMAEDCDMTLVLQSRGYRIIQDNQAMSYTEAPQDMRSLVKQRFRWTFGVLQALWAHRSMWLRWRYGWLGMYSIPVTIIVTLMPLVFWPVLVMLTVENIAAGNYRLLLVYGVISLAVQFVFAVIALRLSKRAYHLLWALPFARFVFAPVRGYILLRVLLTGLRGRLVGWGKLIRTGEVSASSPTTSSVQ